MGDNYADADKLPSMFLSMLLNGYCKVWENWLFPYPEFMGCRGKFLKMLLGDSS